MSNLSFSHDSPHSLIHELDLLDAEARQASITAAHEYGLFLIEYRRINSLDKVDIIHLVWYFDLGEAKVVLLERVLPETKMALRTHCAEMD